MSKLLDLAGRLMRAFARFVRAGLRAGRIGAKKPGKEPPDFIYPLW